MLTLTLFSVHIQSSHSKTWILALFNLTKLEPELLKLKIKDFSNLIIVFLIIAMRNLEKSFWPTFKLKDRQSYKQLIILVHLLQILKREAKKMLSKLKNKQKKQVKVENKKLD